MSNDNEKLIEEARRAQRAVYLATDAAVADDLSRIMRGLADALEASEKAQSNTACIAWWEGVNDQWKHRPIGNRILESACPYPRDEKAHTQSEPSDAQKRLDRIAGLIDAADDGDDPPSLREIYLIAGGRS